MNNFGLIPKFATTPRKGANWIYAEFRILRKVATAERRGLWQPQLWMDFENFFTSSKLRFLAIRWYPICCPRIVMEGARGG